MNENIFFSNNLIREFLNNFESNLKSLPLHVREQHIDEVKADLYGNALELSQSGIKEEEVPKKVLKEFVSPDELAFNIEKEYKTDFKDNHKANNSVMKYYTVLSIATLGSLSLPILLGYINISSSLPLILFFILSNIWLIFNKKILWNISMLNYFKKMITFCQTVLLALPFGFFSIRIILSKKIELFSLYYLIVFLIIVTIYILSLKSLYKKEKSKL